MPGLRFDVEAEDVTEGDSSVVESAMTAIYVDLVIVLVAPSISSGSWGTNCRFLVWFNIFATINSSPCVVFNVEPPAVIESSGWIGMSTKYEESISLLCDDGNMLGTWSWNSITFWLLLFPTDLL